jgi:hypothetical protein
MLAPEDDRTFLNKQESKIKYGMDFSLNFLKLGIEEAGRGSIDLSPFSLERSEMGVGLVLFYPCSRIRRTSNATENSQGRPCGEDILKSG